MKRILPFFLAACMIVLSGCSFPSGFPEMPAPDESGTDSPGSEGGVLSSEPTAVYESEEPFPNEEILLLSEKALEEAVKLKSQYYYEEAVALLDVPEFGEIERVQNFLSETRREMDSLVNYTGELPHIFFHSLIVYPELVFMDKTTPMGGYNSGFSEKAELEKILPQLYERGYVLYDLDSLYIKTEEGMQRQDIMLPPGKTPLILSVDDVAYAYGDGFAEKLYLDEEGNLVYSVPNPQGGRDLIPDGDVMGVVDLFVKEHPDFAYHGHKGTIALTGFQGAFGYYPYTDEGQWELDEATVSEMSAVVEALKKEGWNFASHSYTHNGVGAFFCPGCSSEKMQYDTEKWLRNVTQYVGNTRLYIAPFGFRVPEPALREIIGRGFDVYCTVDNKVYNEINDDYFLMSRIEISGYSMTYYTDLLNDRFFNVNEVFDRQGRPPVI